MGYKFYSEPVEVSPVLRDFLKRCMATHIHLCNHVLEELKRDPELSFRDVKQLIIDKIEKDKIKDVVREVVFNEAFYIHKRHRNKELKPKQATDMQYLTLLIYGYKNRYIDYQKEAGTLTLRGRPGVIRLGRCLPDVSKDELVYLNLSYSGWTNRFELSLFKQGEKA